MRIQFKCPTCSATGTAGSRFEGKLIECPKCGGMVLVSTPPPESWAEPPPVAKPSIDAASSARWAEGQGGSAAACIANVSRFPGVGAGP